MGSELDYAHLKAHPFFEGINFEKLNESAVPINKKLLDLKLDTDDESKVEG